MKRVPKSGPSVFAPSPGDSRTVWEIPVSETTVLHARWPAICCGRGKPERVSVIRMSEKPLLNKPLMPDPYLPVDEPPKEAA